MPRALVVEDYESLQMLYRSVLEADGYDVIVASDGEDALTAARTEPDLILLDLLLPKMGGLEFLRAYDLTKHPKVKVIVFSNMSSAELYKEAKALGISDYLIKAKFSPKELMTVVRRVMGKTTA